MRNFVFHNPTKIIFGHDTIKNIGAETAFYGKKALLVYGCGSIFKNGIYQQVTDSLASAGITVCELGGVRTNPTVDHARQGIRLAKDEKIDVIVAVGGGSVIDSGKAIAAGALVDHDVWQFFKAKKGIKQKLPLICVVTLAASGSEMNSGMVLTDEQNRHKLGVGSRFLHPEVSILDPTATFTVPPDYTAYGAVDALSHLLEFYLTAADPATPVQDRLIEGLAINIMEACEGALKNPENYQARADLMWCSALALNGLTFSGMGRVEFPAHMIEHSLSSLYNIAHGAGLAVILPAWLTDYTSSHPEKFCQFASRVFEIKKNTSSALPASGIDHLKDWFAKISCPTRLSEIGISSDDISKIAVNALTQAKIWRLSAYTQEKIEKILSLGC